MSADNYSIPELQFSIVTKKFNVILNLEISPIVLYVLVI